MGCGSSSPVVAPAPHANGHTTNGHTHNHDDGLPTVVLPDTPARPKPPIAFEIPIEELDTTHKASTPPPHLQRLLQPPTNGISLPDIEGKLAEAELRRQAILQQRAASAQRRTQKMTKGFQDMKSFEKNDEQSHKTLIVPPDPGLEDKYI